MALDNFRTQKIIWDKANRKIFETIEANSGDSNGRKLVVQIINQETTEVLSGTTLSLGWKSRKGAKGLDAFNVVDASKGIFEIYYTTEMLSNIGNIEASLILIDSTGRIESSIFTISVRPSTVDDESVKSENSFTALTEALVKVNDFDAQLAQKADKGNVSVRDINKNLGKFDQTFMTDEFLQQMAGTTPINAVPSYKGITHDKLANKSVGEDSVDKNLHNIIVNGDVDFPNEFGYNAVPTQLKTNRTFIPDKPLNARGYVRTIKLHAMTAGEISVSILRKNDADDFEVLSVTKFAVTQGDNLISNPELYFPESGLYIAIEGVMGYLSVQDELSHGFWNGPSGLIGEQEFTATKSILNITFGIELQFKYQTQIKKTLDDHSTEINMLKDATGTVEHPYTFGEFGATSFPNATSVNRTHIYDYPLLRDIQFKKLNIYSGSGGSFSLGIYKKNSDTSFTFIKEQVVSLVVGENAIDINLYASRGMYIGFKGSTRYKTNVVNGVRFYGTLEDAKEGSAVFEKSAYKVQFQFNLEGTFTTKTPNNRFVGGNLVVLGDSISDTTHGASSIKYFDFMAENLQLNSFMSYGIASSTITDTNNDLLNPMVNRYSEMSDNADLVILFGGTNDFGYSVRLGTFTNTDGTLNKDKTTFYGSVNVLLEGLISKYPESTILIFLPLPRESIKENSLGLKLKDYVDALRECAEYYSSPTLDLFAESGMNPNIPVIKELYMPDGTHPNNLGQNKIATLAISRTNNL